MKKLIIILAISLALSWIIPFSIDYLIFASQPSNPQIPNGEWVPTIWSWATSLGFTLTFSSAISISLILGKTPEPSTTSAGSHLDRIIEPEPSEPYSEKVPSDHTSRPLNGDSSPVDDHVISPSKEVSGSPSRHKPSDSPPREKTSNTPTNATKMMACPFCGSPINPTVSSCPYCHNLIKK